MKIQIAGDYSCIGFIDLPNPRQHVRIVDAKECFSHPGILSTAVLIDSPGHPWNGKLLGTFWNVEEAYRYINALPNE